MDLAGFVKLRLLDTRSQASIDRPGQAVQRNARQTIAWTDATLAVVRELEAARKTSRHAWANYHAWVNNQPEPHLDAPSTGAADRIIPGLERALRQLAEVWSDHPDHDTW